ncbi:MAG TPA: sn-glycerol-3-phosphate ABC transporter ATP-binding protein UgpC, partial [Gaiellaceae bacterium]|nr:sn-glycerol-3-phosphate ABC transporter ATP-binding protein UgpC [Gaiellaceae bacterium]
MADVVFKDVDKVYDNGFQAVTDLSLEVHDGEFLVLVGPSGCGKTTALRMVAGLEEITDGELYIGDRVVNTVSPKERDVAMVFQNYALYPHLSVFENIAFGLRLRKEPKDVINERVTWAAELLDLTDQLERKPKQLSGGQRQRVAMGRAIVRKPQVFLMDEPLSNLDAKLRVQMRADIAKLQDDLGTTTLYVTHDQIEAMTMGDRVAVMNAGVLQQVAVPQMLYDKPENLFVAGFIGTPPMNLLESRVSVNGGVGIELAGKTLPVPDEALKTYPQLRSYDGGTVIAGLRSQFIHPASERPDLPTIDARVELVEALGAESIAYFRIEGRAIRDVEVGQTAEGEAPAGAVGSRPNLVAQFPAHVVLKLNSTVPVAV